jgi:predicted SnoaL-like aldol condensation-catalyzing enzyme
MQQEMCSPGSDPARKRESDNKNIAMEFIRLVGEGSFKEGLRFFAPDCKTHNPYIAGGMEALTDAMISANKEMRPQFPEAEFSVKHIIAGGEFVTVHTELLNSKSKPSEGGLRQSHLFRFEGGKIVEYWDITQQVLPRMPNASGAF